MHVKEKVYHFPWLHAFDGSVSCVVHLIKHLPCHVSYTCINRELKQRCF